MSKRKKSTILIIIATVLILSFIAIFIDLISNRDIEVGFIDKSGSNSFNASFMYFDGSKTKILHLQKNQEVTFDYNMSNKKGDLNFSIIDPNGKAIFKSTDKIGKYNFTAGDSANYTIKVTGKKAKGSYNFSWNK